jgi:Tfp pilus assembly protein PilF
MFVLCLVAGGCVTRSAPVAQAGPAPGQTMTLEEAARLSAKAEQALNEGRFPDAGAAYVRVVTAWPDNAQAWSRLATVYLRTQQYGAAQRACEQALRADPRMGKARANLALAHLYQFRAAGVQAAASTDVPEPNRMALAALVRDVDHALAPTSPGPGQ